MTSKCIEYDYVFYARFSNAKWRTAPLDGCNKIFEIPYNHPKDIRLAAIDFLTSHKLSDEILEGVVMTIRTGIAICSQNSPRGDRNLSSSCAEPPFPQSNLPMNIQSSLLPQYQYNSPSLRPDKRGFQPCFQPQSPYSPSQQTVFQHEQGMESQWIPHPAIMHIPAHRPGPVGHQNPAPHTPQRAPQGHDILMAPYNIGSPQRHSHDTMQYNASRYGCEASLQFTPRGQNIHMPRYQPGPSNSPLQYLAQYNNSQIEYKMALPPTLQESQTSPCETGSPEAHLRMSVAYNDSQ